MKRATLIKIHLYLSAIFAPFLFLMAFTGTSYLMGFKGNADKKVVETFEVDTEITEAYVRAELARIDPGYSFEYTKKSADGLFTRPTTRDYYQFERLDRQIIVKKVSPNFLLKIIEIHKGHGPGFLKFVEKILGIGLILILISGIWLALTVKRDKKITLVLMLGGFLVLLTLAML